MTRISSTDPRAQKTQRALTRAIKVLLSKKPFREITVSEITEHAGVARHTFYNHYDTKADLLDSMVDSVLDHFLIDLGRWNLLQMDTDQELALYTAFFTAWKDHSDVTNLLRTPAMEPVIIERLKVFFSRFYEGVIKSEIPEVDPKFVNYMINFNAYSLVGMLMSWLESGMEDAPEHLADFLHLLTGARQRIKAVQEYQELFSR